MDSFKVRNLATEAISCAAPVAQPAQARELSPAEIDAIVYKCRQDGDDSTYSIVRAAIAACKGGK